MEAIIDYRGKTPKKTDSGIPLITAKIIKGGSIQPITEYIAEEDYESWMRRGIPKNGDIVMTTEAPLGEVAQLDGRKVALAQRVITLRGKPELLDNSFLKYLLSSQRIQHQLEGRATGTTVKGIKQSELRKVLLDFPSLGDQKAIAHILATLEDKIELNRQMNETLEAMAQAFFKSWFVDFDPVIDNALAAGNKIPEPLQNRAVARQALGDQRKPLPPEIHSHFPDRFVFTDEMGWIPEGWLKKTLGDLEVVIESGKRPKGGIEKSLQEGVPSVGAESLLGTGQFDYSKVKYVRKEFAEKTKKGWVSEYDVAIYKDGANVGDPTRVSLFGNRFPFDCFMVNEHVFLLRSNLIGQPSLYWLLKSEQISHQLLSMGTSKAAQPGLNQKEVLSCSFVAPDSKLFEAFNSFVFELINLQLKNGSETQTLAELRDTLLPKLLSGELRVSDAEKQVADAL